MNKLKFLTGNALPFENIAYLFEQIENNLATREFYLQPFTPDMIEKYFAGWKEDVKFRDECDAKYSTPNSFHALFDKGRYWLSDTKMDGFEKRFYKPRTLQEFISDCDRAGITLEWREE